MRHDITEIRRRQDGSIDLLVRQLVVPAGDGHARRESLDIPFERTRVCLVEVVEVEHESAVGPIEETEVRQMSVAAELGREIGRRCVREVGSLHRGRPPVEGER